MSEGNAARALRQVLQEHAPLVHWQVGGVGELDDINLNSVRAVLHVEGHKLVIFMLIEDFSIERIAQEIGYEILRWKPGCEVEL